MPKGILGIPQVNLVCCTCNKPFTRNAANHYSHLKVKESSYKRVFCSRPCWIEGRKTRPSRRDEFSPFRSFLAAALQRNESKWTVLEPLLSLEDLKEQWELQGGICPYSGHSMILPPSMDWRKPPPESPYRASLDRVDSSKPYQKGNVEFVCLAVNFAKHDFPQQTMLDFFAKMRQSNLVLSHSGPDSRIDSR